MKILYHHRTRSKDGQTVHIEEMVAGLRRRGHEVVIVGPPAMECVAFGADAGLVAFLKRALPKMLYELLELGYSLTAYRRLRRAYIKYRPDCLYERYQIYLPAGVWLRRRYGLPVLLEVNSPLVDERQRVNGLALPWLARRIEHYTWRGVDVVLPATEALKPYILAAGVPEERVRVVRNAVNLENFDHTQDIESAKRRLGLEGRLVLGFTGFVRDWHRVDRIINYIAAADRALNLHLLLVGDGPSRAELEALAHRLGVADRLTITGVVPREAVSSYIAAFDVALNLDVVTYALALKLFEYLAMGRAIVAHDWPNIREILTDGKDSLLFNPDVPNDFSRVLDVLCRDAELRRRLGAGARRTIEEKGLTWDNNAARVETLFRDLLDARSQASGRPIHGTISDRHMG